MSNRISAAKTSAVEWMRSEPAVVETRSILGVSVLSCTKSDAAGEIVGRVKRKDPARIAFLNAHGANLANQDQAYLDTLNRFHVLPDGIGVDLASRLLYGTAFPDNLNGTDFIPHLLSVLPDGTSVALLGAEPGIAQKAIDKWAEAFSQVDFTLVNDGFFDQVREREILLELEQARPDVLLVALGNPAQEKWIDRNCTTNHATVAIGVGALFDFIAEKVPRAPRWMINARIEWMFRLWLEPARMWRRYVVGNPVFLLRVLKQRLFGNRENR